MTTYGGILPLMSKGRPRQTDDVRNVLISLRLSADEKNQIDREAMRLTNEWRKLLPDAQDVPISDVIRQALKLYFKEVASGNNRQT